MPTAKKKPARRVTAQKSAANAIDPRSAQASVSFIFEQENWEEDARGENGDEPQRYALALKRNAKAGPGMDAETAMVMSAEDRAVRFIENKTGLKSMGGHGRYYDDQGVLNVSFIINSLDDIARLRAVFDGDGRTYLDDYIEASGLTLLPQGVNGPILRTDSSPYQRGTDLDEWLDEHGVRQRRHSRTNGYGRSSMVRRNPEVECREPRKYFDRYRNAQVMHGGEFVQLEGCWTGSRYVGRAEGAKKRTTISKKVVRQKAFRTPSRVKGVRVRRRK